LPYVIRYTLKAQDHLRALTARQRSTVLDRVEAMLSHEPRVETRNRKPLRANSIAPWELRLGELRVYYDLGESDEPTVLVVAIGVKTGSELRIAGEVVNP
jgi:mRNA-degrading endonuclease RelE of RelBE toxin-antitoxin system